MVKYYELCVVKGSVAWIPGIYHHPRNTMTVVVNIGAPIISHDRSAFVPTQIRHIVCTVFELRDISQNTHVALCRREWIVVMHFKLKNSAMVPPSKPCAAKTSERV